MRATAFSLALSILAMAAARPAAAAPFPINGILAASFGSNPIAADGQAGSVLRVQLIRSDADPGEGTRLTITIDAASAPLCSASGATTAQGVIADGHADFLITSTTEAGICHVTASADALLGAEALLETRTGGIAARLTVSGNDSPRMVADALTLAVDIDDVFVNLVAADKTTVVIATLDAGTCAGAPAGDVTIAAGAGGVVTDGRAWFIARSLVAYDTCRVTFSAAGLRPATVTATFSAGTPDHLSCYFSAATPRAGDIVAAAVDVRDAWGNRVVTLSPYRIQFARTAGDHTTLVSESERAMRMGAVFFFVQADSEGSDEYTASIALGSGLTLPRPATSCAVSIRGPLN